MPAKHRYMGAIPHKRFRVYGGPGGRLATVMVRAGLETDRTLRGYTFLFAVNRPCTPEIRSAALAAALRGWEVV